MRQDAAATNKKDVHQVLDLIQTSNSDGICHLVYRNVYSIMVRGQVIRCSIFFKTIMGQAIRQHVMCIFFNYFTLS